MIKLLSSLCLTILLGIILVLTLDYKAGVEINTNVDNQRRHIKESYASDTNLSHFAQQHSGLRNITLISTNIEHNKLVSSFWSVTFNDDTNTMVFGIDGKGNWINTHALTMTMQSPAPFKS
ncbi:hypothetical protein CTM88_18135 [Photobacterium aquimaris]|uniref:Uncharacterized protein n=1 Tax=Photobacterium aquimaris TaxID=512643 RepID=A0A2T3IFS9_9GAMM|nr:hypothetical protein AYY20_12505 [Photobacterium aquimaris]PSU25131.1 hypothetical protein CTM88_18135 [Photobacterium aquimaris]